MSHGDVKLRMVRRLPPQQVLEVPGGHVSGSLEHETLGISVVNVDSSEVVQSSGSGKIDACGEHPGLIKAPVVGTAYRAPGPHLAPFVEVGSKVQVGQVLMIIEAMKTMNHIQSPCDGTVSSILVEDAMPVEFDQPLLVIE